MLTILQNIMSIIREKLPLRLTRAIVLGLLFAVAAPASLYGQEPADDDFYDDEFVDDDFGSDDYFDDDYADDEYLDDEYADDEFGDDEFGDEFYDDEFADDDGFEDEFTSDDDFSDDEFIDDDAEPLDAVEDDGIDLADDQSGEVELNELEQKEIKEPRIPWGYTATVTISSPWLVGSALDKWWYSTYDVRVTLDFPTKRIGGQSLTYGVEVSTYKFENTHPSGGQFQGGSILGVAQFPWGPLNLTAGAGLYGFDLITGGVVFGADYKLSFIKFFNLSLASRMNYVMESTTLTKGAAYWFDVAGSIGFNF